MEQDYQKDIEAAEWKRIGWQLLIGSLMAIAGLLLIGMIEAVATWIES